MRIDFDCVREILLLIESLSSYNVAAEIQYPEELLDCNCFDDDFDILDDEEFEIASIFKNYTPDTVFYHIDYCYEAGLVTEPILSGLYSVEIKDLTAAGHELLANIREPDNWSAVKSGLSAIRNYSLDAINAISTGITQGAIAAYLTTTK